MGVSRISQAMVDEMCVEFGLGFCVYRLSKGEDGVPSTCWVKLEARAGMTEVGEILWLSESRFWIDAMEYGPGDTLRDVCDRLSRVIQGGAR